MVFIVEGRIVFLSSGRKWIPSSGAGTNQNPSLSGALVEEERASGSGGGISIYFKARGVLWRLLLCIAKGEASKDAKERTPICPYAKALSASSYLGVVYKLSDCGFR
jgi:hypothetical protein